MAYLKEIKQRCGTCSATATVQLHNSRNAPLGFYCKRHGEQAHRELQQREEASWERDREERAR